MNKGWKRITACILSAAVLFEAVPVSASEKRETGNKASQTEIALFSEEDMILDISGTSGVSGAKVSDAPDAVNGTEYTPPRNQNGDGTAADAADGGAELSAGSGMNEEPQDVTALYADGKIKIYTLEQLEAVGSGQPVMSGDGKAETFGQGEAVTAGEIPVTYSLDTSYELMGDIPLNTENIWTLPEGFSGTFSGGGTADSPLYDNSTDTIYIYNSYQIAMLCSDTGAEEPVMSHDMIAEEFGMGQFVYPDGTVADAAQEAAQGYLTYSREHNYVLSAEFTAERPTLKAQVLAQENGAEGRDFKGQVIYEEGGTEYILIGNKEQLAAIGSGDTVYPAVYQAKSTNLGISWQIDYDDNGNPIMLYGGDADLTAEQNGVKDYTFGKPESAPVLKGRCGVVQTGEKKGTINPNMDIDNLGHKYDTDENYIIFRDIDLGGESEPWTPLMFSGTMEGRLWMEKDVSVTISDIYISQSGKLPIDEYMGIGFFGTISNKNNGTDTISLGTAKVSHLILNEVSVSNSSSEIKKEFSLVDVLLGSLLNSVEDDPATFATGGFAGRIYGDAVVSDCEVRNLKTLSNTQDISGGFVGHLEGITRYDVLTGGAGNLLSFLTQVLNIIPVLGLGDLITLLINGGLLNVGNLIPIGYYSPVVENCKVTGISEGTIGSSTTRFNGGFAGRQIGSTAKNCTVSSTAELTVQASSFGGGFSGAVVNAEIKGALSSLGVDLANSVFQSVAAECRVDVPLKVQAEDKYAGGFTGVLANSYAIDPTVNGVKAVSAASRAGGLAGYSTVGWGINADLTDQFGTYKDDLLTAVKKLLGELLQGDSQGDVLSLVGVKAAEIYGADVTGDNLIVSVTGSYAGGLVGQSDGIVMRKSEQTLLDELRPFKKGHISYTGQNRGNSLSGLSAVSAGQKNAGGAVGEMKVASAGGLLDTVLALGNYMPFTVENVDIIGVSAGYKVTAAENAGGAFGEAVGGTITNVNVSGIAEVSSDKKAAGFAAVTGTGSLAESGGLDILGLGLIEVGGLLSVADAIETVIGDSSVTGTGFTVSAVAASGSTSDVNPNIAGGFLGVSASTKAYNCKVNGLKKVQTDKESGIAGGFAAQSTASSLAGVTESASVSGIADINGLVSAVNYLVPQYTGCQVNFVSAGGYAQVTGCAAGGFAGDFQSGTVNKLKDAETLPADYDGYAVKGLEKIEGSIYAGGFGGNVYTGGLADTGGLSLLGGLVQADVGNLVRVLDVYVPYIYDAGVQSAYEETNGEGSAGLAGFSVIATDTEESYAGGYIGYGRGVQIKNSNVKELKYTEVTDSTILSAGEYAVQAASAAGGFAGVLDIGDAASVGSGLSLLGTISVDELVQGLSVAASRIENCHVQGRPGGFSILASGEARAAAGQADAIGHAGGYAGEVRGASISNCDALNFAYIVGQESAGGYAGSIEPGDVASVAEDTKILEGLVTVSSLASILESFIPVIEVSKTTAIPCGGCVWADGFTTTADDGTVIRARGMAGGYTGHNVGGRIEGSAEKEAAAYRIRTVYGGEYAGGFTGFMEAGNVADTGSLSVLFGLIEVNSPAAVLQAVYPTETNTAVYGPLRGLTVQEWNDWVAFVGSDKSYGDKIQQIVQDAPVEGMDSDALLAEYIDTYAYGYDVTAGRTQPGSMRTEGGAAGGYAGRMEGGVVTDALAMDVRSVAALRSAGGFAGEMLTANVANLGNIGIGELDVINNLGLLSTFVPAVNGGTAVGWQSGVRITANGVKAQDSPAVGYAGGYVGHMVGGQIGVAQDSGENDIQNLRRVDGTYYVGGFAGLIESGGALSLNTDEAGLLDKILNHLIDSEDLAQVLNATISTVDNAHVKSWDEWGIIVNGAYTDGSGGTGYALAAGGFAGSITGAVIGSKRENPSDSGSQGNGTWFPGDDLLEGIGTSAEGIRQVTGGNHAGGYVGVADVGSAASVGDSSTITSLLELLKLEKVSVADMFRTYIFHAEVTGSGDNGLTVSANTAQKEGTLDETVYSGNAGGFAGSFLDATVENSNVRELSAVRGLNNTGGFIGLSGKSGLVDLDKVNAVDGLLNGTAGVLDVFGSTVTDCSVAGMEEGYTVKSSQGVQQRAGGVIGYADLARVENCNAAALKQVSSGQTAGGYAGETSFAYLADIEVSSILLKALVPALNMILKIVGESGLTGLGSGIKINLGIIKVQLIGDGNVIAVNLLGLPIEVRLSEDEVKSGNGFLKVNIGDSSVEIPYYDGKVSSDEVENNADLKISLVKANRTKISGCTVSGIADGYDVYGGGSGNASEALSTDGTGKAGGFVGLNGEGLLEDNNMLYCDTVKGESGITAPFIGKLAFDSSYAELGNTEDKIVGDNNTYKIYRSAGAEYSKLSITSKSFESEADWTNIFVISHYNNVKEFAELEDVQMISSDPGGDALELGAYVNSAEARLMDGTDTFENGTSETPEPPDAQDPCDEYIDLTVNKVWRDNNNQMGKRPDALVLELWETYTDGDGNEISGILEKINLTEQAHGNTANTWKYVRQDLPAYKTGDGGEKYWITYEVREPAVPEEYQLSGIEVSEDGFTITVTNSLPWYDRLPVTGGMGTVLLYVISAGMMGGVLVSMAVSSGRSPRYVSARRRRRRR